MTPTKRGAMVGRRYLLRGEPVTVLIQFGPGGGPRNVLAQWPDGRREVRPWWRGKRVQPDADLSHVAT